MNLLGLQRAAAVKRRLSEIDAELATLGHWPARADELLDERYAIVQALVSEAHVQSLGGGVGAH